MPSRGWSVPKLRRMAFLGCVSLGGCAGPGTFHMDSEAPPRITIPDAEELEVQTAAAEEAPKPKPPTPFELPPGLPGAQTPPIIPPKFMPDTPAAERQRMVRELYPARPEKGDGSSNFATGDQVSLQVLLDMAYQSSPAIRKAQANAEAASGSVIQAGLAPNPTAGYQVDQWISRVGQAQGANRNSGQQGAYYNQTFKFPGKLSLAQAVAGFDFMNAQVAVRRSQVDLTNQVRTAYFSAIVAQQSVETNATLLQLLNETYELQLKQVAGGEAAGYEPLQLYAQSVQAKNNLTQAENATKNAWRQLTAAIGVPDLKPMSLSGKADTVAPVFDQDVLLKRTLDWHTDVVTAKNSFDQAQVNVRLQRITPYPDFIANTVVQHDNALGNNQFNLQFGITLPLFDRNQGNIKQALGQLRASQENIFQTQNTLRGQFAEAYYRYETNRVIAVSYRDKILPNLMRAYRAIIRRYQVEPDKVSFNDIVTAQQNLVTALQAHLAALDAQWKALTDLANTAQLDELEFGK